ncbi:Replicase polyprotein 1ab, partial [Frankliniella fusca]
ISCNACFRQQEVLIRKPRGRPLRVELTEEFTRDHDTHSTDMSAEILHSSRGGRVLLLDGQKFHSRLNTPKKSYWKCAQRKCPATAITRENANGVVDVIKETSHDHIAAHSKYVDDGHDQATSYEDDDLGEEEEDVFEDDDAMGEEEGDQCEDDDYDDEDDDEGDEDDDSEGDEEQSTSEETDDEVMWRAWVEVDSDQDEDNTEMDDESDFEDTDGAYVLLGDRIKSHKDDIRLLRRSEPKIRLAILEEADKELICFLNEICVNLLDNYFTFSKYEWELLNNFEATVRFLADECESWRIKKKSLLERPTDPFLSVLLNLLAESQSFCK